MKVKGVIAGTVIIGAVFAGQGVAQAGTITEDSDQWNCLTMGNKVCGPAYAQLPKSYVGLLVKGYDIPRSAAKHALVTYIVGKDDSEAEGETLMHIVTPAFKGSKLGRVVYF